MSKKLIINTCYECPMCEVLKGEYCCNFNDKQLPTITRIPDWCPLEEEIK